MYLSADDNGLFITEQGKLHENGTNLQYYNYYAT